MVFRILRRILLFSMAVLGLIFIAPSNGELRRAPDSQMATYWRHMTETRNGLVRLRGRSEDLERRKPQFHKIGKALDTGTDRGGSLTGYLDNQHLEIAELRVGLSRKDIVDDFYYQNGTLFFVKEVVKSYRYVGDTDSLDVSMPIRETKVETGYSIPGKFVGGDTPNPSDDENQPSAARADRLRILASKCASALRSRDTEANAESWK